MPAVQESRLDAPLPIEHPGNWLLMLDVDGSLLDIAHRPDTVTVPLCLKTSLLQLYELLSGAVVLVSGRPVAELDALFKPLTLPAVGLHGGEERIAGAHRYYPMPGAREKLKRLGDDCRRLCRDFPHIVVETKPLSVALHYRLDPQAGPSICAHAQALAKKLGPDWMVQHGKMVCEIKPLSFHKLSAVRALCERKELAGRKPVFVGDDQTDEPALAYVHNRQGYAIRVGAGKTNDGILSAETPADMRRWLSQLAGYGNAGAVSQPLRRHTGNPVRLVNLSRLVVVSNRVTVPPAHGSGGLAVAVNEMLKRQGGVWAGWDGKIADTPSTRALSRGNISYLLHNMQPQEHEQFYARFCNGTLWPLLHYNIGLSEFDRGAYETYLEINRRYAKMIAATVKPEDCIWVHDFHFIPLGQALRELGVRNRIGFFLHTPFAAREVLLTLPVHKELMSMLYAYDVAGFQTQRDLNAFRDYAASEHLRAAAGDQARNTLFGHFPVGIQTEHFANVSRKALKGKQAKDLQASLNGRQLILGVDRLDYSKGILHRLKAVEELLKRGGRWQQQFTFLQIAPPTREGLTQFEALRAKVESLVGHINGMHTDIDWVPIRFLARSMGRDNLAAFYRLARICLVTPLRDGMNLVAKEFIAAQDPENPGVLVLSRFAGAAEELTQALLINPYDIPETADAIEQALLMPLEERKRRWRDMFETISHQTLEQWYGDFLAALADTRIADNEAKISLYA